MSYLPWIILAAAYGACVGSFLNVVIYRVPAGLSVVRPASRCPSCGYGLAWYDNVPVLAWLWLRGRCRKCRLPISPQYPLVEAVTGCLFALVVWAYLVSGLRPEWLNGGAAWPVLLVHLVLLAGLIAATKIDAALFIIPLSIPWVVAGVAVIVIPGTAWWDGGGGAVERVLRESPAWGVYDVHVGAAIGGVAGWAMSVVLLALRVLPRSFADEAEVTGQAGASVRPAGAGEEIRVSREDARAPAGKKQAAQGDKGGTVVRPRAAWLAAGLLAAGLVAVVVMRDGWGVLAAVVLWWWGTLLMRVEEPDDADAAEQEAQAWLAYPHPRREALKEVLFLLPPMVGLGLGWWLAGRVGWRLPRGAHPAAGCGLGLVVGGGVVWLVRVLGTLGFGKEAMGLGDVHLMAAVGAVLGPVDATVAFFVAPFGGLVHYALTTGMQSVLRRRFVQVPYGPHLAGATVLVMLLRETIFRIIGIL